MEIGFPVIKYQKGLSQKQWGQQHGEAFRDAIRELAAIRTDLILSASNRFNKSNISENSKIQLRITEQFSQDLSQELKGIMDGANLSPSDCVILNNYTDFRDLSFNNQILNDGCSTVYVNNDGKHLAGQTWDMHNSARRFLAVIDTPDCKIMTVVGCVGLMGFNSAKCMIAVNNLNTTDAVNGVIWPVMVRKCLQASKVSQMSQILKTTMVTSGHNYLIADSQGAQNWEITPTQKKLTHTVQSEGFVFHTNHCLAPETIAVESAVNISPTSLKRYKLIQDRINKVKSADDFKGLLTSHDEFPLSVCSHPPATNAESSETCGGAMADLKSGQLLFWRGCEKRKEFFIEREFQI